METDTPLEGLPQTKSTTSLFNSDMLAFSVGWSKVSPSSVQQPGGEKIGLFTPTCFFLLLLTVYFSGQVETCGIGHKLPVHDSLTTSSDSTLAGRNDINVTTEAYPSDRKDTVQFMRKTHIHVSVCGGKYPLGMADYFHILDEDQLVFYFGKWILIYTSRGYKPAKHLPVT